MRIAVFIKSTTFNKSFGGLETQNKTLCEGLASRGHDIVVFTPNKETKIVLERDQGGVKYVFIPSSYRYLLASLNPNSWEKKSVEVFKSYHSKTPFDLVISQSSAGIGVIKNKVDLNVKAVSIAHGTASGELKTQLQNIRSLKDLYWALRNIQYFVRQFFGRQREYILGANMIVAVSNAVKKQLEEETFVIGDKVVVIHNGIDPSRFANINKEEPVEEVLDETENPVKIIYLGRVVRSKGIFELADVLTELSHENFLFEIVGDGEDLEKFKDYLDEKHISKKTKVYGKTSYDDVMKLLFNADIFVLPSMRVEGFPMTLPEAMFASLPIVATAMGGIPDAIDNGKTGYVIKPEDWADMREKILQLIKNEGLRKELGKNGRSKAEREFTLDTMLDKYEKLLQEVLA